MGQEPEDVKAKEDSSASTDNGSSNNRSDAMESSSNSQDDSQQDVKAGVSMADFVKQGLDKQAEATPTEEVTKGEVEDSDKKAKSDPKNGLDKEEAKKDGGEKEDSTKDEEKAKQEVVEGKPVPYERFKEVIDEKNVLKDRIEREYSPKVKDYDTIVKFVQDNQISSEQFQKALQAQAILSKVENGQAEPSEALKVLEPIVAALKGMTGDSLPADLQAEVDAGEIKLERAKEMAQLRAKNKFGEAGMKRQQQSAEQQRTREFNAQCETTADQWEAGKRSSDPDYLPKKGESEPDGKWEFVRDKFIALLHQKNSDGSFTTFIDNPRKMAELLERAYKAVDATYKGVFNRKSPTRKSLSSNGSSAASTLTTDAPGENETLAEFTTRVRGSTGRR